MFVNYRPATEEPEPEPQPEPQPEHTLSDSAQVVNFLFFVVGLPLDLTAGEAAGPAGATEEYPLPLSDGPELVTSCSMARNGNYTSLLWIRDVVKPRAPNIKIYPQIYHPPLDR